MWVGRYNRWCDCGGMEKYGIYLYVLCVWIGKVSFCFLECSCCEMLCGMISLDVCHSEVDSGGRGRR